jgi:GH15 family glucan-1,4-alpha-glucosidase
LDALARVPAWAEAREDIRRAIETQLVDARGLVRRYNPHDGATDGVSGGEGPFLLCTYWLAECLAMSGLLERAREVFERVTANANDLGLLSEEIDSASGELLGNFPQAMSHIGLVNAAWAITQAESGSSVGSP